MATCPRNILVIGLLVISAVVAVLPSPLRSAQGATVVINEVQYDPPPSGFGEAAYEWIELLNTGPTPVELGGWQLADSRSADTLPSATLGPGQYLVVAGGDGFAELYPDYRGQVVILRLGNGLANSGDQLRLLDPAGTMVDGMSYGGDTGVLDPCVPLVEAGHSLERVPAGHDTDTAADWVDQPAPSPGRVGAAPQPTLAPTAAPLPTAMPGAGAVLNEYLPAPRDIDWDGDGQATAQDEWVELYNLSDSEVDLRGWQLDDVGNGGSSPYTLPQGTVIAPRGHLVIFRRDSRIALNNGGDSVRLLRPDGTVADQTEYSSSTPDASFARAEDGVGPWTDVLLPSPGQPNGGAPTPTPRPSATGTPGEGSPHPASQCHGYTGRGHPPPHSAARLSALPGQRGAVRCPHPGQRRRLGVGRALQPK